MENEKNVDIDQLLKDPAHQTPKPRKIQWWMIAIPVVLVLAVAVACLWQPIVYALHPEQKLAVAMGNTLSALSQRYKGSPLRLLGVVDPDKPHRMELDLVYADAYTDTTELLVDLTSDPLSRQTIIDFSMEPIGDLGLYIDPQGFAIAHNAFNDAKFYGVTYESFREDLMKSVFGPMLQQNPEVIDQLEEVLQSLQKALNQNTEDEVYFAPYAKILGDFVATIEVESGTSGTLNFSLTLDQLMTLFNQIVDTLEKDEHWKEFYSSNFSFPGNDVPAWEEWIQELRDSLQDLDDELDMTMHYTFFIGKGNVVTKMECRMEMEANEEKTEALVSFEFGTNPVKNDLTLTVDVNTQDQKYHVLLKSSLLGSGDTYSHSIALETQTDGETDGSLQLRTQWDAETGDLKLRYWMKDQYEEMERNLDLNFILDGRGFVLSYAYEGDMGELLSPGNPMGNEGKLYVTMRYKEHSKIEKPEWINLDQWDEQLMQDLQEFITGLIAPLPKGPRM